MRIGHVGGHAGYASGLLLGLWTFAGLAAAAQSVSAPVPAPVPAPVYERSVTGPADALSGLVLPPGFKATVFAEGVGPARHMAVRDNGDVYVRLRRVTKGGGVVALRDENGRGVATRIERFGAAADIGAGTGIGISEGYLYVSSDSAIYRYRLAAGALVPTGAPELVISGLPGSRGHTAKPFTFGPAGPAGARDLYVTIGSPSNVCHAADWNEAATERPPCPELKDGAGIWRLRAARTGQSFAKDATRYATGIRNAMAIAWNADTDALYAVQHGRDQLGLWPQYFSPEDNAALPAEEFQRVTEGSDFGWPYTYYDGARHERMLAPEYGGDGKTAAPAGKYADPILALPAHWAPNALLFYEGAQFPAYFKGGAFIAFHGSWNRSPFEQQGFNVVFVPFKDGAPVGSWQIFADGFKGRNAVANSRDASYRPTALAEGPDGSLYVADSVKGRIWKITYQTQ